MPGKRLRDWICLIAAGMLCLSSEACEQSRSVEFQPGIHLSFNSGSVEIAGIDSKILVRLKKTQLRRDEWQELFPVFVGESYPEDVTQTLPILGSYKIENQAIYFSPRFPFREELAYHARLDLSHLSSLANVRNKLKQDFLEKTFYPAKKGVAGITKITHIFPSTDEVPENLLKIYVHFSAPMSLGNAHSFVHLQNSSGQEIPLPFVEVEQGLWDRQRKRLTLFFHPGRIKRGVAPNLEMGPPFKAGENYRLIIDNGWKDAYGKPLAQAFQKEFQVIAADREAINEKDWQTLLPRAETIDALTLLFPEPLDHALLSRMILIVDEGSNSVMGRIEISKSEMRWEFIPDFPWKSGNYSVAVNTALEDLAGNNLNSVFDRELAHTRPQIKTDGLAKIPFRVTK